MHDYFANLPTRRVLLALDSCRDVMSNAKSDANTRALAKHMHDAAQSALCTRGSLSLAWRNR